MPYVIRNCPVNYGLYKEMCGICEKPEDVGMRCADCTDCVLKRIVQVCNEYSDKWEDCDFSNGLSEEILKLLDIQEIE